MGFAMKSLAQSLSEAAGVELVQRAALELFHQGDAEKALNACESQGIGIMGIEAFRIEGSSITPDMDWIADYSDLFKDPTAAECRQSVDAARQFVREMPSAGYFLHFTLKYATAGL